MRVQAWHRSEHTAMNEGSWCTMRGEQACVGVEDGAVLYHPSSGWVSVMFGGSIIPYDSTFPETL